MTLANFHHKVGIFTIQALQINEKIFGKEQVIDALLLDRAAISGELVLSEFTKMQDLNQFKK
jgi:methylglutaconyl-CoA hydratase